MKRPYRKWTDEDRGECAKLHAAGYSYKQIGEVIGRSRKAVENHIKEAQGRSTKLGKSCGDCGVIVRDTNACGYCKRCNIRHQMKERNFEEARLSALRASPRLAAGSTLRRQAAIRAAQTRLKNPKYRAWLINQVRTNVAPLGRTPEAEAKRDRKASGQKVTEHWLGWCPHEYRDEYKVLIRSKGLKAAEAREIIESAIEAERAKAKRKIVELSPFEKQEAALSRGATLIANDLSPSLTNPANYGEAKWERLAG